MPVQNPSVARAQSTVRYLDIWEIKDNVVVLRNGTLRSVVLVSSVNFALKSDDEQTAVIQSYTSFLNSLNFTLQIVVQSRKLDIDDYLNTLKAIRKTQTNELLAMQTQEYIQYVQELVELADIMSKRFYVIVPYDPGAAGKGQNFFAKFKAIFSPTSVITLKQQKFEQYRSELQKRADYVVDGLSSVGLKAVQLDTQGLIELYYNTYNPLVSKNQKLPDLSQLRVEQ
jgi:hypothetical protein